MQLLSNQKIITWFSTISDTLCRIVTTLTWQSTHLLFICTTYLKIHELRGCWRRNKNHYLYCLEYFYPPSSLSEKERRREIYFITPKKSLLGLEVQETRCNLSWGWRGKSLVHFCLNTYILHWGNLWGTKGFPLDNNTFQDLTILINNQGSEESLLILLFFF